MTVAPQCFDCKHFRESQSRDGGPYFCDAFPDPPGIPEAILTNEHDHTKPFAGDHRVRFEPTDEASTEADR